MANNCVQGRIKRLSSLFSGGIQRKWYLTSESSPVWLAEYNYDVEFFVSIYILRIKYHRVK